MTRTCITTVTAIRSEEWIKAVISGGAALFSVDGSAKERVNAALNDMPIAKANSSRKIIHPEHPPHHLQRVDIREDG